MRIQRGCGLWFLCVVLAVLVLPASVATLETNKFGSITITNIDFNSNGPGNNLDTMDFWNAPDPSQSLMIVTDKSAHMVEVWKYPFTSGQQQLQNSCFNAGSGTSGVVVDQGADLLYVAVGESSNICVFSLPDMQFVKKFGSDRPYFAEPQLALLQPPGEGPPPVPVPVPPPVPPPAYGPATRLYVTNENVVYIHDPTTGQQIGKFTPMDDVEPIDADGYHNWVLLPDENGPPEGPLNGGVYVYDPDGNLLAGNHRIGGPSMFTVDTEDIVIYTCPGADDGTGVIVVSDYTVDEFELFDRSTWQHLGTMRISGVTNTDGFASTNQVMPNYPLGLFVALDNSDSVAGISWETILSRTGMSCTIVAPTPSCTTQGYVCCASCASGPHPEVDTSCDAGTVCCESCQTGGTISGDLNGDRTVNIFDLVLVAQDFGKTSGFDPKADATGDGKIDIFDLVMVAQNFGATG